MMKFLSMGMCLLVIALYIGFPAQAQNTETDSLKRALVTTKDDSRRVIILEGLSYAYLSSYPDTALQYALEGLELAKKIKDRKGEALCTNALGNVYFHLGDHARSLEMYLTYLEIAESLNQRSGIAVAYFNIAIVYTEEEDYRHALNYIFKAKQEDEKAKDSSAILFDAYSLGNIYLRMKKADSALYYTNRSYELAQRLEDNNMIAAILNNFGEIYFFLNKTADANKYYSLSIPYAEAITDNEVLTSNYYGLAKVYKQRSMQDSSIYYARKALLIANKAPFLKQVLETSTFLSEMFSARKQFDSAFRYQLMSIAAKDSLFNVAQIKKFQNLKFQEQQRQQSIETARIKYRDKVRLFIVIFASGIFLLTALVLWRNNKQKQKTNMLLVREKEKVEKTLSQLRLTQAQLIQSEKMASLGELAAGIAHEIQNPLNFVNNFSEINTELIDELQAELKAGHTEDAFLISTGVKENDQKINIHGKRADAIVKGMLQHSRGGTGKKEPTDINTLADEYLRICYHGLRAKDKSFNPSLQTNFDQTIGKINIVSQDIGRLLLNLFTNAFYSVAEKKKLQPENYEPIVLVSTKRIGDIVEISVKDNGGGISQKVIDKIFQPFFTTKPTGQGTGLGLSLAYDIATKEHGGQLRVESTEGEGAEFVIELPIQ